MKLKRFEIETSAGKLVAEELADPSAPGIALCLIPKGADLTPAFENEPYRGECTDPRRANQKFFAFVRSGSPRNSETVSRCDYQCFT